MYDDLSKLISLFESDQTLSYANESETTSFPPFPSPNTSLVLSNDPSQP